MKRLLSALALLVPYSVQAVEGMWQPHQLPAIAAQLRAAGIGIDPKLLSDLSRYPMNAIVSLGGCTASFVSPLGLVVTNHHCAYGSIQYNSTPERNLIRDGFLAKTLGEELRAAPTARIFVTEEITEVSAEIEKAIAGVSDDRARFDAIDARQKALVAECEAPGGYRCDVYVFHGGAQYFLVRQLEIRDVRLVYAPSKAIGAYGGDIDNWMWPRHTGDFAFYRAYVGPDGKPADFNEANVPYRPRSYLKVQPKGVAEGDYVMIAGYPGRTNRYRLAEEVRDAIEWQYPTLIARYRKMLALIEQHTADRPDAAIRYASAVMSFNNALKNFEGNLDGFRRIDAVAIKSAEEQAILAWAREHAPDGVRGYEELRRQLADLRAYRERDQILQLLAGSQLISAARDLYRLAIERAKPDAEREVGFQLRDEPRIQARLEQMERRFDAQVERAIVEWLLADYLALPADQRLPELDRWIAGAADAAPDTTRLAAALDRLYASELTDTTKRMAWFGRARAELEAATDPALQMAVAMMPAWLRLEDESKRYQGEESRNRPAWMAARIAYAKARGQEVYADANSSLRVTFGNVQGYSPRDAVNYAAFTWHTGIVEKHTGTDPFDATEKQLAAIRAQRFGPYAVDGRLPVNFVADLDITGGNSGSPVLNARAELIGLAFDGNYEAISSGWIFNPVLTRTIAVDVRYMLWVMDAVDGAHNLLKEMGIKPAFAR
jgi:hypothetical protein